MTAISPNSSIITRNVNDLSPSVLRQRQARRCKTQPDWMLTTRNSPHTQEAASRRSEDYMPGQHSPEESMSGWINVRKSKAQSKNTRDRWALDNSKELWSVKTEQAQLRLHQMTDGQTVKWKWIKSRANTDQCTITGRVVNHPPSVTKRMTRPWTGRDSPHERINISAHFTPGQHNPFSFGPWNSYHYAAFLVTKQTTKIKWNNAEHVL